MANYISNEQPLSIPAEKAKQILNSLHEHVLYYDRDMKILWANLAALNSVEISLEKIKEKRCWSVWAQRKTPCDACPVILSMETGSLQCIEKTTPDGRSWLVKGYPLKDKHGNVIGGIETSLDITDRKKAEKNLKITFDILNRSPAVGFMWKNTEGWPVLFVTPNVSKLFGYTSDEFISGKISYEKAVYPEDLSRVMEEVRTFSSDKERKEFKHKPYRILSKNGEVKWVLDRTIIDRNNDGDILYYKGIIENITDRIKTDQVIKESEEKYRNLFHHSNDGIFIHDLQGNIIDINQKAIDLLGYTEKEILSLKVHNLHPPEVLEKTKWAFETIIDKGSVNFEIEFKRKNGDLFIADVSSSLFNLNESKVVQGIVRDITLRRHAEKEKKKLEFQLQQTQKMKTIGTLAGGVAHDFNNLLMGIQGHSSLMLMDTDSSHPHFEHLQAIEKCVKSAADLTEQLLAFAMGGKYEVKPTDINELIRKSSRMFGRTKKEIRLHRKYQKNVWTVEADQCQIEQVLMNLYINAWQAMPGGGALYVQTENVTLDEDYVKPFKIKPGRYVKISVTDTGVGMNEATLQNIFDPFFTTKEMGRGSGLGLASVYGITRNHGGFINVYSQKGEGATFNIYLPASESEVSDQKSEVSDDVRHGDETVLLVDDEKMIIDVSEQFLEKMGYTVLIARSGKEATEIYEKNKDKIDMVILDMIMPDMSGSDTFDRLKEIKSGVKVLLSSGYRINGQATEILERGCDGFVQKPFNMKQLSWKIREVLDKE